MKRFKEMIMHLIRGMSVAVFRFPLTVLCLTGAAGLICYMISLNKTPSLAIQKLMFTFLVGAILGMTAQFTMERFEKLSNRRHIIHGVAAFLTAGYFIILWPAPEISPEISVRTLVAVFALVCAVLWIPSYQEKANFNKTALIHFKSLFTSILYSAVLSAGLAAIIATIDILLFHVDDDAYSYMMTIIWVMFATVYYLSLLPRFNSEEASDLEVLRTAENYPKFLVILVSNIAIPLISTYTVVLFAYFIKILVTLHWPSGQLGPMVLIYSAAGLLVYVLASILENRFAILYQRFFPKVLIPIVIMQMISVAIRLNAYGVTESRYYVTLFGIFSIVIGILLSFKPVTKNRYIALLAAGFAIFSVLPPLDAFTVSRVSQINRVEGILEAEGILINGKLIPKADASKDTKIETTNILSYLERRSSLKYIEWIPNDFVMYEDMRESLGFDPTYPGYDIERNRYFHANLDMQQPIVISDYDISVQIYSDRFRSNQNNKPINFTVRDSEYLLFVDRLSKDEARVSVKSVDGSELISTGLYDFIQELAKKTSENGAKEAVPPEQMTLDVSQNGYKMKIIFQNVSMSMGTNEDAGVDYSAIVLFGVPESSKLQ